MTHFRTLLHCKVTKIFALQKYNLTSFKLSPTQQVDGAWMEGAQWRRIVDETMTRHASADVTALCSARARDRGTHDESKTINFSRQQKPTALRAAALRQLRLLKLDHSTRRGAAQLMRAIVPLEQERRTNRFEMELIQDARDQSRAARIAQEARARRSCSIAENVTGSTHACVRACFA